MVARARGGCVRVCNLGQHCAALQSVLVTLGQSLSVPFVRMTGQLQHSAHVSCHFLCFCCLKRTMKKQGAAENVLQANHRVFCGEQSCVCPNQTGRGFQRVHHVITAFHFAQPLLSSLSQTHSNHISAITWKWLASVPHCPPVCGFADASLFLLRISHVAQTCPVVIQLRARLSQPEDLFSSKLLKRAHPADWPLSQTCQTRPTPGIGLVVGLQI